MKEYKHLNLVQRSEISALKASGKKQKDIAAYVGCSVATVSRELSRNKTKTGIYNPKTAQELANERKERFSRKRVFNQEKKSFVIHAIKEDNWSAEQIVGYCRENNIPMVGKTTIYEFIHQDKKKGHYNWYNFIILKEKLIFMVYGYIRVSTDRQTVENQRFEIKNFCKKEALKVDTWIEETISGTKDVDKRKLGALLAKMQKGDILICSELSRLGRNLLMIMAILNECMKNDIQVWTIKDNYRLGSDISSKVLAFAFGLSAEIERNLISQRTKEALARKKAEGVFIGRPKGSLSKKVKLTGNEDKIRKYIKQGMSQREISLKLKVSKGTVNRFIKREKLHIYKKN